MQNKTIIQIQNNVDFAEFMRLNFMKEFDDKAFPKNYIRRNAPREFLEKIENKSEVERILDREIIRDNIYLKYKFDILENPYVVFYEDTKSKKLKPYKKYGNASNFAESLLSKGIYSILIQIMNYNIECKIFRH